MSHFDEWNEVKKKTDQKKIHPFFKEREIYFARLGFNIGHEQNGKGAYSVRPVLITKKFNKRLCWVIPLSRVQKRGKYYFTFSFTKQVQSTAIVSQLRLIDAKRLERKLGNISKPDFDQLQKTIIKLFLESDSF